MITLYFYKNFDEFDDYKEIPVDEVDISPLEIGRIIHHEQQFEWFLALDEYNLGEKVFLLSCKQEFELASLHETLDNFIDETRGTMDKLIKKDK